MAKKQSEKAVSQERVNILKDAVLVTLHFSNLGNRKKMDSGKVATDADADMLHVSKALLDSEEYRAILNHRHQFRWGYFAYKALPSVLSGTATFVMPLAVLQEVEERFREFEAKDRELVEVFCRAYPARVAEARGRLKSEFDPADYPPVGQVRAAFRVRMAYFAMATPEALRGISGALYAREQAKFHAALDETAKKIDAFLGESLADLVDWTVARLSDRDDGKEKAFGKRFEVKLERVRDFLESFRARNLTGNAGLESLVEKAEGLLRGVDAEACKDVIYRARVRKGFETVKATLDTMIEARPTRRIVLED